MVFRVEKWGEEEEGGNLCLESGRPIPTSGTVVTLLRRKETDGCGSYPEGSSCPLSRDKSRSLVDPAVAELGLKGSGPESGEEPWGNEGPERGRVGEGVRWADGRTWGRDRGGEVGVR